MDNTLYGRHIISADDFSEEDLFSIFARAQLMEEMLQTREGRNMLGGLLVRGNGEPRHFEMLFSPSLRTSYSFRRAIQRLGGTFHLGHWKFSASEKGESDGNTALILTQYGDVDGIIVRKDETPDVARTMADALIKERRDAFVINAGDGNKEHPTQMLTDLYTIWKHNKRDFKKGVLRFALVGDLHGSRTIHSLIKGMKHFYGHTIYLVGPEGNDVPKEILSTVGRGSQITIKKVEDPLSIASQIDVWYFTRLQDNLREESASAEEKSQYARKYGATEKLRNKMYEKAIVLHPLPHNEEYDDNIHRIDPRFIHMKQAENGMYVRMALLTLMYIKEFPTLPSEDS